jgi:CheY-like chemotaxis protein
MRKIAVIGFTSFEFGAFEAFFKMVGVSRPPGYAISSVPADAEIVFVNGTSRAAVDAVAGLPDRPEIIVVGTENFGTGYHVLPRPIRLTAALSLVTQILASRTVTPNPEPAPSAATSMRPAAPFAAAQPMSGVLRAVPAPAGFGLRAGGAPAGVPAQSVRSTPVANTASQSNSAARPAAPDPMEFSLPDDILVVDDSDIALRFMEDHLGGFGFRVHLARSGEECLMLLSQRAFRCVFLDVMMTGIDGYQTCRMIKQRKYQSGAAPTVIMMTSRSGAIDRVRGALAGCDGYLVKPVDESKLIKSLFQHRVSTSAATTSKLQVRLSNLG